MIDHPLYDKAVRIVIGAGYASVHDIRIAQGLGYTSACRFMAAMERDGVIGPYNGGEIRVVIMHLSKWMAKV